MAEPDTGARPGPDHHPRYPRVRRPEAEGPGCIWNLGLLLIAAWLVWKLADPVLQAAGDYLVLADPPAPAGLIVVHGGEASRIDYGADLLRRGAAPRMIVFLEPGYTDRFFGFTGEEMRQRLLEEIARRGIDPQSVTLLDGVDSSWSEVQSLSRYLATTQGGIGQTPGRPPEAGPATDSAGPTWMLVVSNPFHLRRLHLCYRKVFPERIRSIRFCAVPWERLPIRREDWWTREEELVRVQNEYAKIAYYWVNYLW